MRSGVLFCQQTLSLIEATAARRLLRRRARSARAALVGGAPSSHQLIAEMLRHFGRETRHLFDHVSDHMERSNRLSTTNTVTRAHKLRRQKRTFEKLTHFMCDKHRARFPGEESFRARLRTASAITSLNGEAAAHTLRHIRTTERRTRNGTKFDREGLASMYWRTSFNKKVLNRSSNPGVA